jgi:hypothetical protein
VFLGELKFTDLKRILNANGVQVQNLATCRRPVILLTPACVQADFFGGILVCSNGAVNIRKVGIFRSLV